MNWYLLTLAGRDRPGIVARVSGALFEAGCNLGGTSMMRLGDRFGMLMLVAVGDGEAALHSALDPVVSELGLEMQLSPSAPPELPAAEPELAITVHGADQAGIVARVTSAAAQAGFNIMDLESQLGGSPDSPVYVLHMEGRCERGLDALRAALDPLREAGIRVDVRAIDTLIG